MRISELAATTGVPVPTVKFYLREGPCRPARRRPSTRPTTGPNTFGACASSGP